MIPTIPAYAATSPRHPASPLLARICAGRRSRLRVLLPVVRHLVAGWRLQALGAAWPCSAQRHRIVVLPCAWSLFVLGPAGDGATDGRDPVGRNRRDRRLVVGTGLSRGPRAPGGDRRGAGGRNRGRRAPRAVWGPQRLEHRGRHRRTTQLRHHLVLWLPAALHGS